MSAPSGVNTQYTSWGVKQNTTPYTNPSANNTNDPKKNTTTLKAKPRGGWDDDEDDDGIKINTNNANSTFKGTTPTTTTTTNISQSNSKGSSTTTSDNVYSNKKAGFNPAYEYEIVPVDENFCKAHEYEIKLIFDLTQAGGARVKQSDTVLKDFSKACESLAIITVGSILLNRFNEDIPWISKARALYAIDTIIKNVKKFLEYFKFNINIIRKLNFDEHLNEGTVTTQLNNLRDSIVKYLDDPSKGSEKVIPQNLKTEVNTE